MEVSKAALEELHNILKNSEKNFDGLAVVKGHREADLKRRETGEVEWEYYESEGWKVIPIPTEDFPGNITESHGIKFYLGSNPAPKTMDYENGKIIIDEE